MLRAARRLTPKCARACANLLQQFQQMTKFAQYLSTINLSKV